MAYKFSSLKVIIDAFCGNEKVGVSELANRIGKSRAIIHKYLKELVKKGYIKKIGKPPHVKYQKKDSIENQDKEKLLEDIFVDYEHKKIIDESFYKFLPDGKIIVGFEGFKVWCSQRNFDINAKKDDYLRIYNRIKALQDKCGNINAKETFGKGFDKLYLNNVYYCDQYQRDYFGRGKLAEIAFYAKLSQNKKLINQCLDEVLYKIKCLIKSNKYDAIAIIPWSIERKIQLLKILKERLKDLQIPFVNIVKYYKNGVAIPQKSLKTKQQRIINAQNTIFIDDDNIYEKVILIDDFVGSGASLNETARKLKELGVKHVDGCAFVGNLDLSYDIISEI